MHLPACRAVSNVDAALEELRRADINVARNALADGDGSKPRRPAHCHIKPPDYKESSKKRKKYAPTDPQTHRRNERTRYQGFQDPIKRACMRGGSNPHYISRGNPRRKKKSDP